MREQRGQLSLTMDDPPPAAADADSAVGCSLPPWLLDPAAIYVEPAAATHPRGQAILRRFPHARRIPVPSHWQIPELHGDEHSLEAWNRTKRSVLVLGVKKSLHCRPNGRSADYIAPATANGCAMACAYCYVARRKGYANPITLFVNIEQVCDYLRRHAARLGPKLEPNQVDPDCWVYDLGENSDLSVDAALSDNVRDLVRLFRELPHAKGSFATKWVNRELLDYDPAGKTRIRFSLMPARVARVVDVRTAPVEERVAAINDFVDAGYEVHLNFSPVIHYPDWKREYTELFQQVDAVLSARAKEQLAAEVIFLTHSAELHGVNLQWHPRAEELLWTPECQETKRSENGAENVRYRHGFKGRLVSDFRSLLRQHLPYCRIRYAF